MLKKKKLEKKSWRRIKKSRRRKEIFNMEKKEEVGDTEEGNEVKVREQ